MLLGRAKVAKLDVRKLPKLMIWEIFGRSTAKTFARPKSTSDACPDPKRAFHTVQVPRLALEVHTL